MRNSDLNKADLCLLFQPTITVTWPDVSLWASCFDETSFNYMCFIPSETGLTYSRFLCCLVIIALCMYNQLCALGRQSRGTMTFGVQWGIAPWKQMTWNPRGFRHTSFSAIGRLATPVFAVTADFTFPSLSPIALHRPFPILPPS